MPAADEDATGNGTQADASTTSGVAGAVTAPGDLWHLVNFTFGLRLTVVLFIVGLIIGADVLVDDAPIRGSLDEAIAMTILQIAAVLLAGAGSAAAIARTLAVRPDVVTALVAERAIDGGTALHQKLREHLPEFCAAHMNYWFARVTRWHILPFACLGLLFVNRLLLPIAWYPLDWTYRFFDSFYDWLFGALGLLPA